MQFLVRLKTRLPDDMAEARRAELIAAEAVRGRELREGGVLQQIWRLPGRWESVAIYEVPDATALHAAISSLPLNPWQEVAVEALARHPLDDA